MQSYYNRLFLFCPNTASKNYQEHLVVNWNKHSAYTFIVYVLNKMSDRHTDLLRMRKMRGRNRK